LDAGWLLSGFLSALEPVNLLVAIVGCFLGTLVGVLPGLGPTSSVALLFPFTAMLSPAATVIGLGAIYYGAMYGGSTTAVLLNIPGEVASIPAAIEGFPLTKQGRAGPVLVICALVSFLGGIIAMIGLVFFAPVLADIALRFGPFEYLALMTLSFTCAAGLASGSVVRGLSAALLGLFVAMIGCDPGTSVYRFTFGIPNLYSGLDVVSIVVGLFGIGEVLYGIKTEVTALMSGKLHGLMPSHQEALLGLKGGLRGSFIGAILGLLPGITPSVGSFVSYAVEKRVATEREKIGSGAIEGVAGPEAANNAAAVSGFVPLMALGIPTGPVLAIVMAALIIQGVVPGPLMFSTHKALAGTIIASFFIGNLILVILNIPLVGIWVRIAMIPYRILGPLVLFLCVLGSYTVRNSTFDLWVMLVFGFLGYLTKEKMFPLPPFILGLILGPQMELYFRQAAVLGLPQIVHRPVAMAGLIMAGALFAVFTIFKGKGHPIIDEDH